MQNQYLFCLFSSSHRKYLEELENNFLWGIPQEMKLSQAKLELEQTDAVDILEITASNPATLPLKKACQEESEFHS